MSKLLGALVVLVGGCTVASEPTGLCAASSIKVRPSSAFQGESVVVMGENFFRGCDDLGGTIGSIGEEEMDPDSDIRIELRQGSRRWPLASVDAQPDFSFEERVQVPIDAIDGPAAIVALSRDDVAAMFDVQ